MQVIEEGRPAALERAALNIKSNVVATKMTTLLTNH